MQAYNPSFAKIYNLRWARFAQQTAPRLQAYYESTPVGKENRSLLDVCCGTGQLALHFLDSGYSVTGIDLSAAMLEYARANTAPYILEGRAQFLQADAANFQVDRRFGLVVSTFDALNHLPDVSALQSSFNSVFPALVEGGTFIFDLNTRLGLRNWGSISVEDNEDIMLVTRGFFDPANNRAYSHISGFYRVSESLYERFEETAYNTAFELREVELALLQAGFRGVRFCRVQDLNTALPEPEAEPRIYIVAEK